MEKRTLEDGSQAVGNYKLGKFKTIKIVDNLLFMNLSQVRTLEKALSARLKLVLTFSPGRKWP